MEVYLVGGAVRDSLLNIPVLDYDWVIVGATPEKLLEMGYQQVGKNFPVFLHPDTNEEYALARTEHKSGQGYTGFTCFTSPKITLEEDLIRRDLTINAIARSLDGVLIDPCKGTIDLQARILRHVSKAFADDPLRVLRVARFAARFNYLGFNIAKETMELMRHIAHSGEMLSLTAERIWQETEKALESQHPHVYFQVLRNCDALVALFPEIDALFDLPTYPKGHTNIENNIHTMIRLALAAKFSPTVEVRFSALCQDISKKLTNHEFYPHYYDYRLNSIQSIEAFCQRLRIPHPIRNLAKLVVKYHNLIHIANQLPPQTLLKLFDDIDVWRKPYRLEQMIIINEADFFSRTNRDSNTDPQSDYLRQAYHVANSVSIKEVMDDGLHGLAIRDELTRRRKKALVNWKLTQNIMSK